MARWLAICYIRGEHPDRIHAEQAAALIFGDDVMRVQSVASWQLSELEIQALQRAQRLREAEEAEC